MESTNQTDLFEILLENENLHITNREGILYIISLKFLAKETNVGDRLVSYQILRLKHSGLFTMDELYTTATVIKQTCPVNLVNWEATFHIIHKEKASDLHKKLKAFQLI